MKVHIITYLLLAGIATYTPSGFPAMAPVVHAAEQDASQPFDGIGVLHDIRAGSVVINDIHHRLAPGVKFKSPDARVSTLSSFQRGDSVGYYKDGKGRIVELWRWIRQKGPSD